MWRIFDDVLHLTDVHEYSPGSWGPTAADALLAAGDEWHSEHHPHEHC